MPHPGTPEDGPCFAPLRQVSASQSRSLLRIMVGSPRGRWDVAVNDACKPHWFESSTHHQMIASAWLPKILRLLTRERHAVRRRGNRRGLPGGSPERYGRVSERPMEAVLKTVGGNTHGGSNPSSPALSSPVEMVTRSLTGELPRNAFRST